MGRPCSCGCTGPYNLMKINPATGAIIWKAFVPADNSNPTGQQLVRCEAYHGTNDIIVMAYTVGLCRVDSTGSQQWYKSVNGNSVLPPSNMSRPFDVDGAGRIICLNMTGGTQALDGSSSVLWTRASFAPTSFRCGSNYTYTGVGVGLGSFVVKKLDNTSSGTDIWTSATVFSNPTIRAINSINDYFIDTDSLNRIRDNSGAPFSTLAWSPESTRFGPNGYADAEASAQRARATDGSGNTLWSLTGIGGTLFGSTLYDCCTDGAYGYGSVGYYFAGAQLTGTGGTKFNIFKTDISGNLLWTQQYGASPNSTTVSGLCLSDDGYLYAAGGYNPS